MTRAEIIRGAMYRKGYNRDVTPMVKITGLSRSAIYRRLSGESPIKLGELHRMDLALNFTDDEIVQIVKAKE